MKTTDDSLPIERPESPEKHDCNIPKGPVHGDQDRRCFAAGTIQSNKAGGSTSTNTQNGALIKSWLETVKHHECDLNRDNNPCFVMKTFPCKFNSNWYNWKHTLL